MIVCRTPEAVWRCSAATAGGPVVRSRAPRGVMGDCVSSSIPSFVEGGEAHALITARNSKSTFPGWKCGRKRKRLIIFRGKLVKPSLGVVTYDQYHSAGVLHCPMSSNVVEHLVSSKTKPALALRYEIFFSIERVQKFTDHVRNVSVQIF